MDLEHIHWLEKRSCHSGLGLFFLHCLCKHVQHEVFFAHKKSPYHGKYDFLNGKVCFKFNVKRLLIHLQHILKICCKTSHFES